MAEAQTTQMANMLARSRVVAESRNVAINVASSTVLLNTGDLASDTITLNPSPLGIQTGFLVNVEYTFTNNTGSILTRTPYGASNMLQNIKYTDPQMQVHSDLSGQMLELWMAQKMGSPLADSIAPDADFGTGFGDNYKVNYCPQTVAVGATLTVQKMFYLPLAVSEFDLTGAVYGGLSQANQTLQLRLANKNTFVASSTESAIDAVYQSPTATKTITFTDVKYSVQMMTYHIDLPRNANGQIVAPLIDLGTIYGFRQSVVSGMSVNQRFEVPYQNTWNYLSTIAIYANGTQLNAGTDVKCLEVRTANGVSLGEFTPRQHSFSTYNRIGTGLPVGAYYDSFQKKPISITQYGAVSWTFTPSLVNANANLRIGYEFTESLATYSASGLAML